RLQGGRRRRLPNLPPHRHCHRPRQYHAPGHGSSDVLQTASVGCDILVAMEALNSLEQWDDFVEHRYDPNRKTEDFRKYDESAPSGVREFYRLNHTHQTRDFVLEKKRQYAGRNRTEMGVWEALDYLNT